MPEERHGIWKRFAIGAALIVTAAASATSSAAFGELDRVVSALGVTPDLGLGGELAEADAGTPQTIMLIGSDKRARTAVDYESKTRADTVILARLDPSRGATALMSLPRDLRVAIPGHRTDKLNEAYSIGGPRLTLMTVKQLTGLPINHVINVDFGGFREAVDAIGCVYVDVDRRYFNDNTSVERYAAIDVPQGYQRLCGRDALDYVRYRHDDNDLVRSARQQDFLRQAKQQVGVRRLFSDRHRLVDIFSRYTTSDIRSRADVLRVLKLALASADKPIREVHFEGKIGTRFVTASSGTFKKLVDQFLGVQETRGPRGEPGPASTPGARPRGMGKRSRRARATGLEDISSLGRQQAVQAKSAGAGLTVFYPRLQPRGALFSGAPRTYDIRAPDGSLHDAYRMVVSRSRVGEYYGVQGTTWESPPILESPSERRRMGGREFELHFDGDRLRLVAWRTRGAVYWVSNTLLQSLSERQMLALAQSARAL